MRKTVISVASLAAAVIPADATQTWCAVVNTNVPGNELNMRGGPGTEHPILAKLRPGQYVEIDTGGCAERFDANRREVGTACNTSKSHWINSRYVTQAACRYELTRERVASRQHRFKWWASAWRVWRRDAVPGFGVWRRVEHPVNAFESSISTAVSADAPIWGRPRTGRAASRLGRKHPCATKQVRQLALAHHQSETVAPFVLNTPP